MSLKDFLEIFKAGGGSAIALVCLFFLAVFVGKFLWPQYVAQVASMLTMSERIAEANREQMAQISKDFRESVERISDTNTRALGDVVRAQEKMAERIDKLSDRDRERDRK